MTTISSDTTAEVEAIDKLIALDVTPARLAVELRKQGLGEDEVRDFLHARNALVGEPA